MKHKKPMPHPPRPAPTPVRTRDTGDVWTVYRGFGETGRTVVFFGVFYLYVWLAVKPRLIYDCAIITNFPVFYKSWPFFIECVSYPGGLLKYASALLSHLFYYSWAGAAVITVQAWAISACTGWLFRIVRLPGARWLRFVPALLVLAAYAQYSYHLPAFMGVLASLSFAGLYMAAASRGKPLIIYMTLSLASYTVSAAAYLPFAALCAMYELAYRRRYVVGLLYLVFAAAVPYAVGVLVFQVSLVNAYTDVLPISWKVLGSPTRERMVTVVYALYLLPVMGVLAGSLWRIVVELWNQREDAAQGELRQRHAQKRRVESAKSLLSGIRHVITAAPVTWTTGSALLFAVAAAVAFLSIDHRQQATLEIHHYACRRMWPEVLDAARRCPDDDRTMNAVNRALYYSGRFNRDMFTYPQHPDGLLQTGGDRGLYCWHAFDTLIDLGLMNLAEKNLTECLETYGEHPMILERLALVNMVKGRPGAARIYLGALRKTLFHSRWAGEYLAKLDADPNLAGDSHIQHLRAHSMRQDHIAGFFAQETLLSALVEQGNENRMAYEYLMAWHLLNKQLDKLVQALGRLRDFGYAEVPPLYEEAALIYAYGTRKPVSLQGYAAHPEARRRIEHFSEIFNRYDRNKEAAFAELAKYYYQSYFFYYIYASPPARK